MPKGNFNVFFCIVPSSSVVSQQRVFALFSGVTAVFTQLTMFPAVCSHLTPFLFLQPSILTYAKPSVRMFLRRRTKARSSQNFQTSNVVWNSQKL